MDTTALTFQFAAALDALRDEVKASVLAELRASSTLDHSVLSPWLTVAEAASRLRCKNQRIYDLLSQRKLSRYKDGGKTLLSREEVDARVKLQQPAHVRSRRSGIASP